MAILLLGATGFIGSQVKQRLLAQGYEVITPKSRDIDFAHPDRLDLAYLQSLFENVDTVINTVGIMSQNADLMENVHHHTPVKLAQLFKTLGKTQGIKTWINLSALGANPTHKVAFVGSKGRGETAILSLNDENFRVTIARPSLVFGRGGASTELFLKMAKLPISILPNGGNFAIQPVSIDDVAQGLVNLALDINVKNLPPIINFTGQKVMTLAEYLGAIRQDFYQKLPAKIIPIPMRLAKLGAVILGKLTGGIVSADSLTLLENGNVADNTEFVKLLGEEPNYFLAK